MKKIILHLPTFIICCFYRLISCILSKFKRTRLKSLFYWDKYEDKLFTIFPRFVIGKPLFQPIPSERYKNRHSSLYDIKGNEELNIFPPGEKVKTDEMLRKIIEQYGGDIQNNIIK